MEDEYEDRKPKKSEKSFDAFAVKNGKNGKGYFHRIGAAFPHRDGEGHDIDVAAMPVNGRITLRVPKERFDEKRQKGTDSRDR